MSALRTQPRTPDRMAKVLQDYRAKVDPDGANQAEIDAHDEQHIRFTPVGEGIVVKGWLSNETYAQIRTALEQTVDDWYRNDALPDEDRIDPDDGPRAGVTLEAVRGLKRALTKLG